MKKYYWNIRVEQHGLIWLSASGFSNTRADAVNNIAALTAQSLKEHSSHNEMFDGMQGEVRIRHNISEQ